MPVQFFQLKVKGILRENRFRFALKVISMSKIGKLPIEIPQGVNVNVQDSTINVYGPNGNLSFVFHSQVNIEIKDSTVKISRKSETKFAKSLHGLTRSLIANMVKGVTVGHEKVLELVGVGYRANLEGENLILSVGYSHPVIIEKVAGVKFETKENKVVVTGSDKALVGEVAATIRRVRPPEPYKGKGIKYEGEQIRRKAGKALKTTAA